MTTAPSAPSEVREPLGQGLTRLWRLREVLYSGDTEYQHIVIARTAQGISLFCDNDRQSTEFSQLTYHEAMVVPALLLADHVDDVLIIGSSEGVASQLAVTAGARRVDHVDIDRQAVELCARHLPYGYASGDLAGHVRGDGTIRLHYADGWRYLAGFLDSPEPERDPAHGYDIIVIDLPDEREGDAQHNRLYQTEFLTMARSALSAGGVLACQAGCPTLWRNTTLARSWHRFHSLFGTTVYFGSDEHEWSFLFGRHDILTDPVELMARRLESSPYRPETIDADALRGCTVPPYSIRNSVTRHRRNAGTRASE